MLPESQLEYNKIHTPGTISLTVTPDKRTLNVNAIQQLRSGHLTERTGSFEIVNATNTCYLDHHCIISTEFEVKFYSLRPLKFKKTLYSKQDVIRSIDVSSKGLVCIGSDDPTLYFVNIFNPSYSESLNGHKKPVKNLKFNEEGDILVSCSAEGIMNVFALELGKWKLLHCFKDIILPFVAEDWVFHPCVFFNDMFAVGAMNGDVICFCAKTFEKKIVLKNLEDVVRLVCSPNKDFLLCLGKSKTVNVWRPLVDSAKPVKEYLRVTDACWIDDDVVMSDCTGEVFYWKDFNTEIGAAKSSVVNSSNISRERLSSNESIMKPSATVFGDKSNTLPPKERFGYEPIQPKERFGSESLDLPPRERLNANGEISRDPVETRNPFMKAPAKTTSNNMIDNEAEDFDDEDPFADLNDDFVEDDDHGGYVEDLTTDLGIDRNRNKAKKNNVFDRVPERDFAFDAPREVEVQPAFQSGSCEKVAGKRQILALNLIGNVGSITNNSEQYTINVEFHDAALRPFHFTEQYEYNLAALGTSGIILGCESQTAIPSTIYYRPFDAWHAKNSWMIQLPDNESCLALAIGSCYCCVATDQQYLRFFTPSGVQTTIRSLPGPVVSIAGDDKLLFVVYHSAGVFQGNQSLEYMLINVQKNEVVIKNSLPISPRSTLTFIGFSKLGFPITYDSEGVLRGLFIGEYMWTPLFDSRLAEGMNKVNYWPIGLGDDKFYCIILRGETQPTTNVLINDVPLCIPFAELDLERSRMEEKLSREKSMVEYLTSIDENLGNREKSMDQITMQLLAQAAKLEQTQRCLDLSMGFNMLKSFDGAIKIATLYKLPALAERLNTIKQIKHQEQEESRNTNVITNDNYNTNHGNERYGEVRNGNERLGEVRYGNERYGDARNEFLSQDFSEQTVAFKHQLKKSNPIKEDSEDEQIMMPIVTAPTAKDLKKKKSNPFGIRKELKEEKEMVRTEGNAFEIINAVEKKDKLEERVEETKKRKQMSVKDMFKPKTDLKRVKPKEDSIDENLEIEKDDKPVLVKEIEANNVKGSSSKSKLSMFGYVKPKLSEDQRKIEQLFEENENESFVKDDEMLVDGPKDSVDDDNEVENAMVVEIENKVAEIPDVDKENEGSIIKRVDKGKGLADPSTSLKAVVLSEVQ